MNFTSSLSKKRRLKEFHFCQHRREKSFKSHFAHVCILNRAAPIILKRPKFFNVEKRCRSRDFSFPLDSRQHLHISHKKHSLLNPFFFFYLLFKKVPYAHSATTVSAHRGELQCIVGAGYRVPLAWRRKGSGQVCFSGRRLPAE